MRNDDTTIASDPASDRPDPERLAASGELRRLLEAAVDALPEEFRFALLPDQVAAWADLGADDAMLSALKEVTGI